MSTGIVSLELAVRPSEPLPTLFSVELGPSLLAGELLTAEPALAALGEAFGVPIGGGGSGTGTTDHQALSNRSATGAHPASAISFDPGGTDLGSGNDQVQAALTAEAVSRKFAVDTILALIGAGSTDEATVYGIAFTTAALMGD